MNEITRPFIPIKKLRSCLTISTPNFVLKQLTLAEKDVYEFIPIVGYAGIFHALTSQGRIEVSHFRCSWCFFQSMNLPCRHIFHLCQSTGVSLYDNNICDSRWTNSYYRSTHKTSTFLFILARKS